MKLLFILSGIIAAFLIVIACEQNPTVRPGALPMDHSITDVWLGHSHDLNNGGHSHDPLSKETFSIDGLLEEVKTVPDSIISFLHAQHHAHKVVERRSVPPGYETKILEHWKDYASKVEDLPVINPGPGEYVHVMEGYKHGYKNLVIGITETFPGGYPPMHTHEGEESHVLLDGEIMYALGDTIFNISAPYIVNIPPMVAHAFKNIGDKTANLVVIFPTNVWKYDVLDFFPFEGYDENGKKTN